MALPKQIRYFNKRVTNRVMMKIAGTTYSPISIVRHAGRRSGKPYTTPVIAEPVPNGFMFALTYGRDVDWYRNVLAAGQCGLRWHGKDYQLTAPEPLGPATALPAFSLFFRSILRLIGIQYFLRMTRRSA
jgi:deazaflavin-dependent oxidoreductase (nitroreductase family)